MSEHGDTAFAHVDRLYRVAMSLTGDPRDAEDLVRHVLLKPERSRRDAAPGQLFTSLRRRHLHNRRRAARKPAPARKTPHEAIAFVATLGEQDRDVVVAVDVMGLSHEETADALGLPLGTVMSRLYRARDRIVEHLAAQPGGPAAALSGR
jgi:RNA polymerase sigma-70 factor, ECF subfamily